MIERDSSYITAVKILDVEKRYRPAPKHYVYVIQVTWADPTNTFVIYRRYAQFFDLQCKLLDLFAEAPTPTNQMKSQYRQIPFLPGKILFGRSQIREIALERKHNLNIYCQTLISLPQQISRSRPVLEFFRPSADDVRNVFQSPSEPRKPIAKSSIPISQPTHLPTYRCVEDFHGADKIELSMKQNNRVQVIQKHLNGWWFVQMGDRKGFVPGAFLEPVDHREEIDCSIPSRGNYVVNHNYQAISRDEISLEKGSFVNVLEKSYTGWWLVKFHGLTGQFPAVYLTSCEGRTLPQSTSYLAPTMCLHEQSEDDEPDECAEDETELTQIETFYVHTDYHDTVGDCMSLKKGDAIEVHHQHDSGWWLGRKLNDDSNVFSWIPSAFLQKEPPPPPSSSSSSVDFDKTTEPVETIPSDGIYENIGHLLPTEVVEPETATSTIVKETKTDVQSPTPPPSVSRPSDNEECLSNRISVRDLVKKFNRPLV